MPGKASPVNTINGAGRGPCAKHGHGAGRVPMREHYKIEKRASAALDFIAALAIGLTLAGLALAYFDVLWS